MWWPVRVTDGTIRVWYPSTGRLVTECPGHTGGVWGVAVSADGHRVASGGVDGTVRLWEAGSGQAMAVLRGHTCGVRRVALASGGGVLASAGEEGTVRIWEPGTGRSTATLQGHAGAVWSIALSADGHRVASGGTDRMVRLWDAATGRPWQHCRAIPTVCGGGVSADGRLIASGSWDKTLRLWDDKGFGGVSLSADGSLLAAHGPDDGVLQVWDTRTARLVASWQGAPRCRLEPDAAFRRRPACVRWCRRHTALMGGTRWPFVGRLGGERQWGFGRGAFGRRPTAGQRR
jgi:WD40 repeat protein